MEKIREEILPKIDEMELKTYKTKQKDPIYRWNEQMRFEKISTQIMIDDKYNKKNINGKMSKNSKLKKSNNNKKQKNMTKPNKTKKDKTKK